MNWWDPAPDARTHIVEIPCLCPDIEHCRTEIYVADVRILLAELETLRPLPQREAA